MILAHYNHDFGETVSFRFSPFGPKIPLSCLALCNTNFYTVPCDDVYTHPCCHYTLTSSKRHIYILTIYLLYPVYHILVLPWMMLKLVSDTKKRQCHRSILQENYNTPRYRTPLAIPLANYERNPIIACW